MVWFGLFVLSLWVDSVGGCWWCIFLVDVLDGWCGLYVLSL